MKLVVPSMKRRRKKKKKRNIISFSQKMILPQVDNLEKVLFKPFHVVGTIFSDVILGQKFVIIFR
jgi:hypothetical protein